MRFLISVFVLFAAAGCASPTKNVSRVDDPGIQRAPSAENQDAIEECVQASGRPEGNGFCFCDKVSFAPGYESCSKGIVTPINIERISQAKVPGAQAVLEGGTQYRIIYEPLLVKFKSFEVCYLELGVQRVNDDRIMPGGAGEWGGRAACYARENQCPNLSVCLEESRKAEKGSELARALYEAKWVASDFGPFQNIQQILDDQARRSFSCYHPHTKQVKVFNKQTQTQACDACLFWGRDEIKSPFPFGCTVCDIPEAVANKTARSCR